MAHRLTKEGDTFIGEKIIEVRRVGPPQDVWYKLGETTTFLGKIAAYKWFFFFSEIGLFLSLLWWSIICVRNVRYHSDIKTKRCINFSSPLIHVLYIVIVLCVVWLGSQYQYL